MPSRDKIRSAWRNLAVCIVIISIVPMLEKGRKHYGPHSSEVYVGRDLKCAIALGNDMYGSHGLETGFNYEMLNRFASDNHCNINITIAREQENYLDSLKCGMVDILITHDKGIADDCITILNQIQDCSVWAMHCERSDEIRLMDFWIGRIKASDEFLSIKKRYSGNFNPHKRAERGVRTSVVSPYDDMFRKYAHELGWDWRMLAAIVYQESKFSICCKSHRGAQGLMQIMPHTGTYYGVDNLLDPEQNIIAGTRHLKRLQRLLSKDGLEKEELIKFTLAAYNAGEGRIMDCRNLASAKGFDSNTWNETIKVIPMMRDESILEEESVKLGKFQGHETIDYVNNVLSHYNAICIITSL